METRRHDKRIMAATYKLSMIFFHLIGLNAMDKYISIYLIQIEP